jgi:putative phage-type endonuclease
MIQDICAFLQSVEEGHPLTEGNEKDWCSDVKEAWVEQTGTDAEVLDQALGLRLAVATAAFKEERGWEWLLTTTQVAQRTTNWYDETINLLTASELGGLWKGVRTRAALVVSKVQKAKERDPPKLSCTRSETGPMDWGVRYEPVVKGILEETYGQIADLGRIRHRTDPHFAASPDGLFLSGEMAGCLVEIKCPPTRAITEEIPHAYWCQMQLQMEVCDRPRCMYVEAKFLQGGQPDGWISYELNIETHEGRYVYGKEAPPAPAEDSLWTQVEVYPWQLVQLRKVMVMRDRQWFQTVAVPAAAEFWKDVEAARAGTWVAPVPRTKKVVSPRCEIVDDA